MRDDLRRGVLFMLAATVMFSCSDAMSKYVTVAVPAVELATIRYAVFVLMAALPFLRRPRLVALGSRRPWLQVARGLGVVGSAVFFMLALGRMPIADATAINFVNPLLITVLAVPLLGERVSRPAWIAVLTGFAGMILVVRPGPSGLQPAALLVLGCSLSWSVAMLVTRRLVGVDRSVVTLFWTAATGLVVLLFVLPFFAHPLTAGQLWLCLAVGVVASLGQGFAVLAYRHAAASVLAPLSYAQLIWSSLLGWQVFGHVPDRWVLAGGAVIAASGITVVRLARARTVAPLPPVRTPPRPEPAQ